MRHLIQVLAVGVMLLSIGAATADQLFKLLPSDGAAGDFFGYSIGINNGIVAVGAYRDGDNGRASGSAYLFDSSTGVQITKLLPNDGAVDDFFGYSIGIDNGMVAVGARLDDDLGTNSGSAYLFDASTGAQIAKLLPNEGAREDQFGFSIGINNGIVAVGVPRDDDLGRDSGSAYLFDVSTGAQIAKLLPIDGAAEDQFGISIAIDNGIVAIGAWRDDDSGSDSGSAYLFDASTGTQIAKLVPEDGSTFDRFGISIAIDNGIVAVGADFDDDLGTNSGSAYLFDVSTGAQIAKLVAFDGGQGESFGFSIAIDNGIVGVGAVWDDGRAGSAYLFDVSTGALITKLLANDGRRGDQFGVSFAIDNGIGAVGAFQDGDRGTNSGSAYLFEVGPSPTTLTNVDLAIGTILDGEITDLESSNDSYIHTRSGFGSTLIDLHHMDMRISAATADQTPVTLDIFIEAHISEPVGTAQIRLFNFTTGEFDFIGQNVLLPTDAVNTILDMDATDYVSAQGNIELSIKHLVFVPFLAFTFESWVDWVAIDVQ